MHYYLFSTFKKCNINNNSLRERAINTLNHFKAAMMSGGVVYR